jgi:hypothetical protein
MFAVKILLNGYPEPIISSYMFVVLVLEIPEYSAGTRREKL